MVQSGRETFSSEPTTDGARLPVDNLCQDCLNLVTHWVPGKTCDRGKRSHYLISRSAIEGCKLCSHILQACRSTGDVSFSSQGWGKTDGRLLSDLLKITQDWVLILLLRIENTSLSDLRLPSEVRGEHVGTGPSWNQALRWLEQCRAQHAACRENLRAAALSSWMPHRLIDVGYDNDDYVRLVLESDDSFMDGLYTTLSHKWGNNEMFKLTQENISLLMEEGIPISCLPQTFADAIQVTRMLRVPYLWIDSLCIIQDSYKDWAVQSSTMSHVYSNSYLNLAASGAAESTSTTVGLLGLRDEIKRDWHMLAKSKADETEFLISDARRWSEEIEDCPLNKRGWVMQERILSPRILYFGRSQLFWECHELEASEKLPDGVSSLDLPVFGKSLDQGSFETRLHRQAKSLDLQYELLSKPVSPWAELVARYSKCRLTRQTDKLVAIAGIAKRMATSPKDRYLCGIWQSSLPHGLLWETGSQSSDPQFVQEVAAQEDQDCDYLAPSWSWASLPCHTLYDYAPQEEDSRMFQFLRCDVEPVENHDEFGAIKSALMRIRTSLFGNLRVQGTFSVELGNQDGLELKQTVVKPDRRRIVAGTELWFCPLTTTIAVDGPSRANQDDFKSLRGLLLVRVPGSESHAETYRRWGWCQIFQQNNILFSDTETGEEARSKYHVSYSSSVEITLI